MLKISLLPLSLLYKIYYSKQIDSIEFYYLSRALNSIKLHGTLLHTGRINYIFMVEDGDMH